MTRKLHRNYNKYKGVEKDFLNRTPIRSRFKAGYWDLIKPKHSCTTKKTIYTVKRQNRTKCLPGLLLIKV